MTTIEFAAPAGKSFSGQEYELDGTATIGSSFSVPADTVPTRYRVTRSGTGIHFYVFTAGNLKVQGYVNLDHPGANGSCSLCSTYEEAAQNNVMLADAIDAIELSPLVTVIPGRDRGQAESDRSQIIVKLEEQSTLVRSVFDANDQPIDLSGRELEFVIEDARGNDVAVIENADITVSGTSNNVYSFAIPAEASAKIGNYTYSLNDLSGKCELAGGDWLVKRRALKNA